jgi:hypothetical protein
MAISRMQQPRQMYGLGSLVKSITKGVKGAVKGVVDVAKSPLGLAAIASFVPFGGQTLLQRGMGLFGKEGFGLPQILSKGKDFFGGEKTFGKTAAMFGLGGLGAAALQAAGLDTENPNEMPRDVESLKGYLRTGYMKLNPNAEEDEINQFVEANIREYAATGGRIGYNEGTDFQKWLEGKQKFEQGQNAEQLYKEYLEDKRRQKIAEQKTMAANGGRIGFFKGAQADARAGRGAMSPGTSMSGGFRGGGDGGGNKDTTPKISEIVKNISNLSNVPAFEKISNLESRYGLGSSGLPSRARHMAAMNVLSNALSKTGLGVAMGIPSKLAGDMGAFGMGLINEIPALGRGLTKENLSEIGEDIVDNFRGTFLTPNTMTTEQIYSNVYGRPGVRQGGRMQYGLGDLVRGSSMVQPVPNSKGDPMRGRPPFMNPTMHTDGYGRMVNSITGELLSNFGKELPKEKSGDTPIMPITAFTTGTNAVDDRGIDIMPSMPMYGFDNALNNKSKYDTRFGLDQNVVDYLNQSLPDISGIDFIDENFNGIDDRIEQAYGGRMQYAFGSPEENAMKASGIGGLPLNQNPAGITELDLRDSGGFIPPVGVKEKADDIPAMLSNNEFVFTADAVRNMGNGDVNKGAQRMYDMMKYLEKGGRV